VLFPARHNHAGHAPIVTIIVLFVVFGGGSLLFRDYFARRDKRLELAKSAEATTPAPESVPLPTPRPELTNEQVAEVAPANLNADPSAEMHPL